VLTVRPSYLPATHLASDWTVAATELHSALALHRAHVFQPSTERDTRSETRPTH